MGLALIGWGQNLRFPGLAQEVRRAAKSPMPTPGQASGFDEGPKVQALPPPSQDPRAFRIHSAKDAEQTGKDVRASGDVHFSYQGYDVWADQAQGNLNTKIFELAGNVRVQGQDQRITGKRIVVDFENRTFAYTDGTAEVGPYSLQNQLVKPLYIKGQSGRGSRIQAWAEHTECTTCDLEEPHFHLDSQSTDLKPGKRLILRHSKFIVLGKTLFNIPYLYIPLTEKQDRYTPEVGQSRDEGYFVKNKLGVGLRGDDALLVRTDYFSKLGGGLGGDWIYDTPDARGLIRAYQITGGPKSSLYSVDHRAPFLGGTIKLDGSLIRNNYLTAPGTRYYGLRGNYLWKSPRQSFSFTANRTGNKSNSFSSANQVFSVQHDSDWGKRFRTSIQSDFSQNRSGSGPGAITRKVLNLNARASQDLNWASAQLDYLRAIPVGTQQNFFAASDKTPLFSLSSDSSKLFGPKPGQSFPFRTELSVGELVDTINRRKITRTAFDWSAQRSFNLPRDSKWNYALRFKQGLYSDDTAQYVLGLNAGYRWAFGRKSFMGFRYDYLRPEGFTPLSLDRSGQNHVAGFEVQAQPISSLTLSGQTAYDFLQLKRKQTPWQNLTLRADYEPNSRLLARVASNYDTFRQVWSNVRFDLGWKVSEGYISLNSRYDGERHTWANFNLFADGLRWGKLKTAVAFSYNGYTKQVEARHLSLTYDLHCWEGVLQIIDNPVGFRKGREIGLFIRLKALPFETPFGLGRRGQSVGSGAGVGF